MDYFRRVCTIENALCELGTRSAVRAIIEWHGVQLFDEGFYRHLVDEGIIEEEGNALFTDWEDETEMEEEMGMWELEDAALLTDWEDEGEALLDAWDLAGDALLEPCLNEI